MILELVVVTMGSASPKESIYRCADRVCVGRISSVAWR